MKRVTTTNYQLEISDDGCWAQLSDLEGHPWAGLSLLASFDTAEHRDETLDVLPPEVVGRAETNDDPGAPVATVTVRRRSSCWESANVTLECYGTLMKVSAQVHGAGRLDVVTLMGGRSAMPGCPGMVYSGSVLQTLFSPNPEDPRRVLRSAGRPAVIGVTGDSLPGRGHWFFTPAPLYFALGSGTAPGDGPSKAGPASWLALGLVEKVQHMDFVELAYVPADEGFYLQLQYQGHRQVRGCFDAPAVLLVPGVPDPYAGLVRYRQLLTEAGAAPQQAHRDRPEWWSKPMFCGWGAQCHLASVSNTTAAEQCSAANYDRFLDELGGHGLVPSTIVIDDGWQRQYGTAAPDDQRWPDLKAWVSQRHADGQRVLLWWKAWDVAGVADEWCILNEMGAPVAINPRLPEVAQLIKDDMAALLGSAGVDADGLKIDFTARAPSGYGLTDNGCWGIALLHEYLELVYKAAKAAKPDALVVTHTPNPGFVDVTDMVRLNDMLRLDEANPQSPVVAQMRYRAAVTLAACPELLIDTDDWCAPNLAEWRDYLSVKGEIGVPALYYTTHLDRTGEALEEQDYASLRELWRRTVGKEGQR